MLFLITKPWTEHRRSTVDELRTQMAWVRFSAEEVPFSGRNVQCGHVLMQYELWWRKLLAKTKKWFFLSVAKCRIWPFDQNPVFEQLQLKNCIPCNKQVDLVLFHSSIHRETHRTKTKPLYFCPLSLAFVSSPVLVKQTIGITMLKFVRNFNWGGVKAYEASIRLFRAVFRTQIIKMMMMIVECFAVLQCYSAKINSESGFFKASFQRLLGGTSYR